MSKKVYHTSANGPRSSRVCFTLIELLVVIAIIAILAGMLLPALQMARNRAKTSDCINTMKTIAVCTLNYETDWNDISMPYYIYGAPSRNAGYFLRILTKNGYWDPGCYNYTGTGIVDANRLDEFPKGAQCALETRERTESGNVFPTTHGGKTGTYDYAVNASAHKNCGLQSKSDGTTTDKGAPLKKSSFKNPSKLFGYVEAKIGQLTYNNSVIDNATDRHNKKLGGSVGFVDGHVELLDAIPFTYGKAFTSEDKKSNPHYYNWCPQ